MSDLEERNKLITPNERINLSDTQSIPSAKNSGVDLSAQQAKKKKIVKWSIIGGSVAAAIILAIILIVVLSGKSATPNPEPDKPGPMPIYPSYNPYKSTQSKNNGDNIQGTITASEEYNGQLHSEALSSLFVVGDTPDTHQLTINPQGIPKGINNEFIPKINYYFGVVDYYTGYLKMNDAEKQRYEVPQDVLETQSQNPTMRTDMLGFTLEKDQFGFTFTDPLDPTNVFLTTKGSSLVFMDKYIQIDFKLPSQRLYGLGDRQHEFTLGEGTWTMWSKERTANSAGDSLYDDGTGGLQGQSVHPFVLVQTKNPGDFIGIYFKNSNAQSPMIKFNDDEGSTLSYITTGGILEIYFIMHGSAKTVLQVYHNIIGKPSLPPFWALGWGQGSTTYKDLTTIQKVVQDYADKNLPLNSIYLDLHSLQDFTDFQINKKDFSFMSQFVFGLHEKNMQIVALVEAGISADNQDNQFYKRAQELGVLIQSSVNKDKFGGAISLSAQNNHDVYVDWLNPNAQTLWSEALLKYYGDVQFDGLWLDKNAPSGFCSGECPDQKAAVLEEIQNQLRFLQQNEQCLQAEDPYTGWFKSYQTQNVLSTYYLPFIPGFNKGGNLDTNTLSLNATHPSSKLTEYDLHNLFGLMMAETTYSFLTTNKAFEKKDNKPFVLSRSTFPSSGKYSSHFTSTQRSWQDMKYSISSIMNFNMYGIPHTGSDVCGYYGTEYGDELCARWIQLATFYPLARINYQTLSQKEQSGQEPFLLTGNWLNVARDSMHDRYQYLRFMYTCLYEVSIDGGSCFEPLFFEHSRDSNTYKNIEDTFLVGGALKISPILTKGVTEKFNSYFPSGKWVNLRDFSEICDGNGIFALKNRTTVNVHLRPGSLIPFQNNSDQLVKTTDSLLEKPITIIANRDISGVSTGSLFLDLGISADEMKENNFEHYKITVQANTMQKFLKGGNHGSQKASFDKLIIVDASDLSEVDFACYFDSHFNIQQMTVTYNSKNQTLTIENEEPVQFSKFRQINFGSSKTNDLNLCNEKSFQYNIKEGENVDLSKNTTSFLVSHQAKTLPDLRVNISMSNGNTVNVKWTFANQEQDGSPFQIPKEIINQTITPSNQKLSNYVNINNKPNFEIEILSSNGAVVHTINEIVFDRLLNIYGSTSNTTKDTEFMGIFGLGERANSNNKIFYDDGVYSLWASDIGIPVDNGKPPGKNTYGMHPFYMYKNSKDIWVGVFTKLASAQDWYVKNYPNLGEVETTMIAVGGIADLYFIVDNTPSSVVNAYMEIVGKPILPPFWALGWHQSRWGYKTTADLQAVVQGYSKAGIPLDTMWSDIDYMENYRDFTIDTERYAGLAKFVKDIHGKGMSYVPIIDAGIAIREGYKSFEDGVKADVFLKVRDEILVGAVWPKEAAFPDWWAKNTAQWWFDQLASLQFKLDFDGLWEDMNEATNFCSGACASTQQMKPAVKSMTKYTPTGKDLEEHSIPLNVRHENGYLEFDTHSLFGIMEVKTTFDWFKSKQHRPFILSRSSFAGMGKYGFKWLGDNDSTTTSMGLSVLGVMMMNIFGIPFSGSDICGFGDDTNAELCARWHVVGSFQPFTRNHNRYGSSSQEPYVFSKDIYEDKLSYTDIMRTAIVNRYHLNNYYYTQLYLMNIGTGPVYKPLFFDFPDDMNAYQNQTNNVMVGDSLKLGVLSNAIGLNSSEFYFPAGLWCNVFNGTEKCFTSKGEIQTRQTKAYDFYLHLREGKVVPILNATKYPLSMNTKALQLDPPIDFHILGKAVQYPENTWKATGKYYNDDSSLQKDTKGYFNFYEITASHTVTEDKNQILIVVKQNNIATDYEIAGGSDVAAVNSNDYLGQIQIYNALAFKANQKYTPTVHFVDGTSTVLGKATYLEDIDRLIYDVGDSKVCLTNVTHISLS